MTGPEITQTETFARRLKRLRATAGLTQERLAELADVSVRTIRNAERLNAHAPRDETIQLLAAALALAADERLALLAAAQRQRSSQPFEPVTPPSDAATSMVPLPPTDLIGRENEVAALSDLFSRGGARLVTLIGPGGVGKTHLALEVTHRLRPQMRDGAVFVALAALTNSTQVIPTIAQTLRLRESGGQSFESALRDHLQDKQSLLILDTFEHVAKAGTSIADLLAACPNLYILVTSRVALRLRGERHFPLEPLPLPALTSEPLVDALMANPAVRLFVERAHSVAPSFALTPANAPAVADLCRRTQGHPLTIELVAPRTRMFSPQALLARLDSRTLLGMTGPDDLPDRQRTLRAALDWSRHLLAPDAQSLFRKLASFTGTCDLEAVERICGSADRHADELLADLFALADLHLVQQAGEPDGEPRFFLLDTVKEYAQEQVRLQGEMEALERLHASYYTDLVETAFAQLQGPDQLAWLRRLEWDYDNIRAALTWADRCDDTLLGLRLVARLWRFWMRRGYATEGREWLSTFLRRAEDYVASATPPITNDFYFYYAKALNGAGLLADHQGDYDAAVSFFERGLAIFRKRKETKGLAPLTNNMGMVAQHRGDLAQAERWYTESQALYSALDDDGGVAMTCNNLGEVARARGALPVARSWYERGLELRRRLGDTAGVALTVGNLAEVALEAGNLDLAARHCAESLTLWRDVNDRWGVALLLHVQGKIALARGDQTQARELYEESLALRRTIGDEPGIAESRASLAALDKEEGS